MLWLYNSAVNHKIVSRPTGRETLVLHQTDLRRAIFRFLFSPLRSSIILLSLSSVAASSATYTVVQVGTAQGRSSSVARGINSSGNVVGRSGTPANSGTTGFLWTGGAPVVLGTLPGGEYSEAAALNDIGEI